MLKIKENQKNCPMPPSKPIFFGKTLVTNQKLRSQIYFGISKAKDFEFQHFSHYF